MEAGGRRRPVVAIDGPAGAGKSTVAAFLAERFGLLNLETGAMYRAFALKALRVGVRLDDGAALEGLTDNTRIELEPRLEGSRVLLDGEDVSERVREADVTAAASRVSVHGPVRAWMVRQQQAMGAAGGVVAEGRDVGTVVFPDAEVKLFLEATAEVRGLRRFLQRAGAGAELAEASERAEQAEAAVVRDIRERDERDRGRVESPLKAAPDAIVLDSTAITLGEMLKRAAEIVAVHIGTR